MRLKSKIYVQALIRRAEVQGAAAFVVRSGTVEAGAVFIKINRLDGCCDVLGPSQRLGAEGEIERVWTRPLGEATSEEKRPNILPASSNSIPTFGLSKLKTEMAAVSSMKP